MKKIIASLVVVFCMMQAVLSQSAIDSLNNRKIDTLTNKVVDVQKSVGAMKTDITNALKADSSKCNCIPNPNGSVHGRGQWLLVLSPFFLLLAAGVFVVIWLWNFKFTEALTENEPPTKIIKNPEYNSAAIAANAAIPNLSILFPATIEISNLEPTLTELKEIAAAKQAAVSAIQTSLDAANSDSIKLNADVTEAQTELDAANAAAAQLTQAVTDAQTQLDTAKNNPADNAAIDAAQKALDDANQKVTDNSAQITDATSKLQTATTALDENTKTIAKLTDSLSAAKADADKAKNVDTADIAVQNTNAYSANTYRPSISRYIAFITSIVTIILVVCMSSFFIYHYIRTGCPPEFGALTAVLIALGLGVTPYITNKITTAAAANKS